MKFDRDNASRLPGRSVGGRRRHFAVPQHRGQTASLQRGAEDVPDDQRNWLGDRFRFGIFERPRRYCDLRKRALALEPTLVALRVYSLSSHIVEVPW